MVKRLSQELRQRAVAEVAADLEKDLDVKTKISQEKAEEILSERIAAVVKSISRFEEMAKKAEVTVYIDVLRGSHRKDLRAMLTKGGGGVKKDTAGLILDELGG